MPHLISVIVPVYNVEKYLQRCLTSILNNTYSSLEIICVNDGSTDSSLSILKEFEASDPRIKIISKENGGLSSARNAGLKIATGSYIAFIDSDDWVHERYFEYLHRAIIEANADISICNFSKCKDDYRFDPEPTYCSKIVSVSKVQASPLKYYVWRKLFRREIVDDIWFDENEKIEDHIYNVEVILKNGDLKFCHLDSILYAYYQRAGSLITKLDHYDHLNMSKHILALCRTEERGNIRSIISEEAIKTALSSRYNFILFKQKKKEREANEIISSAIPLLDRNKMIYRAFLLFPFLYRFFRILNDRTLLTYEKNIKRSNKAYL